MQGFRFSAPRAGRAVPAPRRPAASWRNALSGCRESEHPARITDERLLELGLGRAAVIPREASAPAAGTGTYQAYGPKRPNSHAVMKGSRTLCVRAADARASAGVGTGHWGAVKYRR